MLGRLRVNETELAVYLNILGTNDAKKPVDNGAVTSIESRASLGHLQHRHLESLATIAQQGNDQESNIRDTLNLMALPSTDEN